jgi:hypothetical protein
MHRVPKGMNHPFQATLRARRAQLRAPEPNVQGLLFLCKYRLRFRHVRRFVRAAGLLAASTLALLHTLASVHPASAQERSVPVRAQEPKATQAAAATSEPAKAGPAPSASASPTDAAPETSGTTRAVDASERREVPSGAANAANAANGDEEPERPRRIEPEASAPEDPLAIPEALKAQVGSDAEPRPYGAQGEVARKYFPYYEEQRGDYRMRLLPPLFLEHTRNVGTAAQDQESLFALLYYRRRSPKVDADVVFPLAWRVRERDNHVLVLGPFAHREAPQEHDNWIAPLVFQGARKDGGYFHMPLLLTTSHWNPASAFTMVGPYFRDRTGTDVDWGVAPLFFHGDNGNADGARNTYTLIPPLLFYQREKEAEGRSFTLVGPVIAESTPKRNIFDIAPLFFQITGKPQTGGIRESHTTLFPFFHYGHTEEESLFVLPGYLRKLTPTSDTMLTPFYSRATTRNGATRFTAAGPVLPLFMNYADGDTGLQWSSLFPFFFHSSSPRGFSYATPLFAHSRSYGESRTTWVFPTIVTSTDTKGWETDIHPIVYTGRSGNSSHTVVAPFFWDFKGAGGRTTVGFPLYWRLSDYETGSIGQLAGNTLYLEKRVRGGTDWSFHFFPLFSYGREPEGYFWNVLFGLAGYTRKGADAYVRALWVPIHVDGPPATTTVQAKANAER